MRWFIRIVILLFFIPGLLFGAIYYVDATSGSDDSTGTSPALALASFDSINTAGITLSAGDSVAIRNVTIRDGLVVPSSGTSGNPITFTAYDSATGLTGSVALALGDTAVISGADDFKDSTWTITDSSAYIGGDSYNFEGNTVGSWYEGGSITLAVTHNKANTVDVTSNYELSLASLDGSFERGELVVTGLEGDSSYSVGFDFASGQGTDQAIYNWVNCTPTTIYPESDAVFDGTWRHLDTTITMDTGQTSLTMRFYPVVTGSAGDSLYIDNIQVYKASGGDTTYYTQLAIALDPDMIWLSGTAYAEAGSFGAIDSTNRWFYNSSDSTVFIYSDGVPSNYSSIEIPVRTGSYNYQKDYIVLDGLHFKYGDQYVFSWNGSDNGIIQNCIFEGYGSSGVLQVQGTSEDNIFDTNTIFGTQNHIVSDIFLAITIGGVFPDTNTFSNNTVYGGTHVSAKWQNVAGWTIENNTIYNSNASGGRCVEITGASGVGGNVFRYNYIYDSDSSANSFGSNTLIGDGNDFYYNLFDGDKAVGISLGDYDEGGVTYVCKDNEYNNNVIYGFGNAGVKINLDVAENDNNVFKNNIFAENGNTQENQQVKYSAATDDSAAVFQYNIFYDSNTASTINYGATARTVAYMESNVSTYWSNNIILDPLFPDAASNDFTPTAQSSAIDAGTNVSLVLDYAGNVVPFNATGGNGDVQDIGAYEYQFRIPGTNYQKRHKVHLDHWRYKRY